MHSREKALSQLRKSLRSEGREEELPMPMQKVSVMADSKEGLEKGLNKAESLLDKTDELSDDLEESVPFEGKESLAEEMKEHEMLDEELPESEDDMESVGDLDEILSQFSPEQLKALMMKIKSMV